MEKLFIKNTIYYIDANVDSLQQLCDYLNKLTNQLFQKGVTNYLYTNEFINELTVSVGWDCLNREQMRIIANKLEEIASEIQCKPLAVDFFEVRKVDDNDFIADNGVDFYPRAYFDGAMTTYKKFMIKSMERLSFIPDMTDIED